MKSVIKKGRFIKWTYQGRAQAELLALAELGQSNAVIARDTKFSDNEINYALTKAQTVMKLKGGYRRNWANGKSKLVQQVKQDLLSVLRQDIQRTLPVQIVRPEPETVKVDNG